MRPGSISKQYRDRQRQRGVYYQLSYTHKMRSRTEHVWPDHVKGLRKETEELASEKFCNWIIMRRSVNLRSE